MVMTHIYAKGQGQRSVNSKDSNLPSFVTVELTVDRGYIWVSAKHKPWQL